MIEKNKLSGKELLLNWFGLSYASWLTIPRVLMQEMPDEWQRKMVGLLKEYEEEFPNQPNLGTRVNLIDENNKLVRTPEWILNYKHPDHNSINTLRNRQES